MSEPGRKCFKCGDSYSKDKELKLYRFPKPGTKSTLRSELWAKYCFPDQSSFSYDFLMKIHNEHKMLCTKHFKKTSFADYDAKKLFRDAVPQEDSDKNLPDEDKAGSSHLTDVTNFYQSKCLQQYPGLSKENKIVLDKAEPGPSHLIDVTKIYRPKYCQQRLELSKKENEAAYSQIMLDEKQAGPSHKFNEVNITEPKDYIQQYRVQLKENKTSEEASLKSKQMFTRCKKYMKKICYLRNAIKKIKSKHVLNILLEDDGVKAISNYLTPTFAMLLQSQLRNCKKKSTGRRWTMEEKIVALRLFKRSPTCYRLLKRLFCLPAQTTLKTLLKNITLPVGVHINVLNLIKKQIRKYEQLDKEFVLMFDEMSIKKNLQYNIKEDEIDGFQDHGGCHGRSSNEATYALVFMIAGLRKKLKQPIAHYFSSSYVTADRLGVLIKEVVGECFKNEINICAVVCDMDGVNRRALTSLGATVERPYIQCGGKEIIAIFDPPHLLKCFRNLFLKYDIECMVDISSSENTGVGVAKWSHIKEFFDADSSNPNFVFAPSLKKEHLAPNTKQKMRVKLAAQVLSHTVAAGMYAKISQGQLSADATITASVVANIDSLFDSMNSNSVDLRRGKPFSTNLSNKSPHIDFFKKMKIFFKNLKFINCRQTPPSQLGWIWTMNAVERLWQHISSKHSRIKSMATRRLQQDPLENFFGCVRANCGANCNPNVKQFVAAMKTAIITNLAHSSDGNCQKDENNAIVDNFKSLIKNPYSADICSEENLGQELVSQMLLTTEMSLEESICEDSGEMQACAYVCGFLIKRYNVDCVKCKEILTVKESQDALHSYISYKEYNQLKNSLKYASKPLVMCVEKCATLMNNELNLCSHEKNIKMKIVEKVFDSVNFNFLEKCETHRNSNKTYIVNSVFHICVKRFCILKNRKYAEENSTISLKRKINILKHT